MKKKKLPKLRIGEKKTPLSNIKDEAAIDAEISIRTFRYTHTHTTHVKQKWMTFVVIAAHRRRKSESKTFHRALRGNLIVGYCH